MLFRGLPDDALSKRDANAASWSTTEELLAQLIEEVSVMTAQHVRKEPRKVPRPAALTITPRAKPGLTEDAEGRVRAVGPAAILQRAREAGQVGTSE